MDGAALAQIDDQDDNIMNNSNSDQQTVKGQNPEGDTGEHDGLPQVSTYFCLFMHRQEAFNRITPL
jgi:hypothetical protein